MIKEILSATNLTCRARNGDADVEKELVATGRGGVERTGQVGRVALTSIYTQMASGELLCGTGGSAGFSVMT